MKKRMYFDKYQEMKFISHLDLIRFFERVFTKTEIPIKFTNGFHPRPKMSFGNPISLGTEAFNEIMDFELETEMDNEELLNRLNSIDVIGFYAHKVEDIDKKSVIVNEYESLLYEIEGDTSKLIEFMNRDEIIEVKEKRGKIKKRDLKKRIVKFEKKDDILIVELINMSPNTFIHMAGLDESELTIRRMGYKKGEYEC